MIIIKSKKQLQKMLYMCINCGGGFYKKEMLFTDDVDFCKKCYPFKQNKEKK